MPRLSLGVSTNSGSNRAAVAPALAPAAAPSGIPVASTASIVVGGLTGGWVDLHGTYSKSAWEGYGGGVANPVGDVYFNPNYTGGDRNGAAIWWDGSRWRFTYYNDNDWVASSSPLGLAATHIPTDGWLAGTNENYFAGLTAYYTGTITIAAA